MLKNVVSIVLSSKIYDPIVYPHPLLVSECMHEILGPSLVRHL